MDMFTQAKRARAVLAEFKRLNNNIKHYLKLKNTADVNRTKLADVIKRIRTEKLNLMQDCNTLFPGVNYNYQYNN